MGNENLKFPYLARQINGGIAMNFGKAIDSVYEKDSCFIDYLNNFSIDNLSGNWVNGKLVDRNGWLDRLGILVGLPRPYATFSIAQAFVFDKVPQVMEGVKHGFSSDRTVTIDGVTYEYVPDSTDPNKGNLTLNGEVVCGKLDDYYRAMETKPISDVMYREYLKNACSVKKIKSVAGIANVVEIFIKSYRYVIQFITDNDILVRVAGNFQDYVDTLQTAFDSMFTTAPKVRVYADAYFEEEYLEGQIEEDVEEYTGSNLFTVSYLYEGGKVIFIIELDPSLEQYKDGVLEMLNEKYAQYDDIQFVVTIQEASFMFDRARRSLDGKLHGFSTDVPIGDITRDDGGFLKSTITI
jgi:hypothetical protein